MKNLALLPIFLLSAFLSGAFGFTASFHQRTNVVVQTTTTAAVAPAVTTSFYKYKTSSSSSSSITALHAEADSNAAAVDPNEIVARRIVVTGDVDGGYYRSCVKNEVRYILFFLVL